MEESDEIIAENKINKIKLFKSKEKTELNEDEELDDLDNSHISYNSIVAADIHDTNVEVVSSNEVTHIQPDKKENKIAICKVDSTYPLIYNEPYTQESESTLNLKEDKQIFIKPTLTSIEPLQVSQVVTESEVNELTTTFHSQSGKANKTITTVDTIETSEVLPNISLSQMDTPIMQLESARTSLLLKEALDVSELLPSQKESPLNETQKIELNASIGVSPHHSVNITEITDHLKENELNEQISKSATPKLNFNLHEGLSIAEVYIENKSGKYYPELIVPTETARKDVLVSNQVLTEIHNVQEKEGFLQALKCPPSQEANVEIISEDSLIITLGESNEKECELTIKDKPVELMVEKDVLLHTSLNSTETMTHVKESEFSPQKLPVKEASIGINELQHKFNMETNIHDSEMNLEEPKIQENNYAQISISALNKSIIEEVNVIESEQELLLKDKKLTAKANIDVKATEPVITAEALIMRTVKKMESRDFTTKDKAIETVITNDANIITSPMVHEHEETAEYSNKQPENVTETFIPNISLEVTETELNESENKITKQRNPESVAANIVPSHLLKTSISELITTADNVDILPFQKNITEKALQQRDLHKEITTLQTMVEEQLEKIDDTEIPKNNALTRYIGNESLNVIEVISSLNEDKLPDVTSANKLKLNAKIQLDCDHKVAITTEISTGDNLNELLTQLPKSQEVDTIPNLLSSIQVSENEVLDTQKFMKLDDKPELKTITPEIVAKLETLKVTEILEHEKENIYDVQNRPESHKAITDFHTKPVAISSELVADISLGYTNQENIKTKFQTANMENMTYKEIIVSTIESNEKEEALEVQNERHAGAATVSIDSIQGIIIEENVPEDKPKEFVGLSDLSISNVITSTITNEAISNEEITTHQFEGILPEKHILKPIEPNIRISALQLPECDEQVTIECENIFNEKAMPTKYIPDISLTQQHSVQVTEITSQSDNLETSDKSSFEFKTANMKLDEIYGKTANIEEVFSNEIAEKISVNKIIDAKSNITTIPSHTVQLTEIITAEAEKYIPLETSLKSNALPDFTEIQAIQTTLVETIDKEKVLGPINFKTQDCTIKFVPHSSTIDTEILPILDIQKMSETKSKTLVSAIVQNDLQKHITELEHVHGEKESELPIAKTIINNIEPKIDTFSSSSKEIFEVQPIETEKELTKSFDVQRSVARTSLGEHQSLISSEIISNYESEDIHVPGSKILTAQKTHGLQECILETETITGEKEVEFPNQNKISSEYVNIGVEINKYIDTLQILSTEKEEQFNITDKHPEVKTIEPTIDAKIQSYIDIDEVVIAEDDSPFTFKATFKPESAGLVIQSQDHVSVTQQTFIEREDQFNSEQTPKHMHSGMAFKPHEHVKIEERNILEKEEKLPEHVSKNERSNFIIEPLNPINISEIQIPEHHEDLIEKKAMKSIKSNINLEMDDHIHVVETVLLEKDMPLNVNETRKLEMGTLSIEPIKHITVTETKSTEKEIPIELQDSEKINPEVTFESYIPLNIEELTVKETEKKIPITFLGKKEQPDISIQSQTHVTVSDVLVRENELELLIKENVQEQQHKVDISTQDYVTIHETVANEFSSEIPQSIPTRDEQALETCTMLQEITNTLPNLLDTVDNIHDEYQIAKSKAQCRIEEFSSYITTEKNMQEVHGELDDNDRNKPSNAEEKIDEMKYLQQTHIISTENVKSISDLLQIKNENIVASQLTTEGVLNSQPQIVESALEFTHKFEPETEKIGIELELNKSYITSENISQENSDNIIIPEYFEKNANIEIIRNKPIQQTEIIVDDDIGKIPASQNKVVTAQSTLTPLVYLECMENITNSQTEELNTLPTLSKESTIITSEISPLIITDTISLQLEHKLNLEKPKKQTIFKEFVVANELQVLEEFVDDQLIPYNEKLPEKNICKLQNQQDYKYTAIKDQPNITGKLDLIFSS